MTVLVASQHLPPAVAADARAACRALDLVAVEWARGIPSSAPLAVIGGLDHGQRRIPDELIALLDAIPSLRLVLCAREPVVRQGAVVGDGRVHVLGAPVERAHLVGALRAALPAPALPATGAGRRFELLRRSHWVAWTRGASGAAISLHEQHGATVVMGPTAHDRAAVADAFVVGSPDAPAALAGDAGVVHLARGAGEWVVSWPGEHGSLWLCSPDRVPERWSAPRVAPGDRGLLRLPAFPHDQLVAVWCEQGAMTGDALARIDRALRDSGAETLAALDEVTAGHGQLTGLVLEVR